MPLPTVPALARLLLLYRGAALSMTSGNSDGPAEKIEISDAGLRQDDGVHLAEDLSPRGLGVERQRWRRGASALHDVFEDLRNVSRSTGVQDVAAPRRPHENVSDNSSWLCKACDITIDMRCGGLRVRHAFFHRVTDCLVPSFGLLAKAREVKGRRCILTWSNEYEVSILPFLMVLADDLQARIIPEDADCVENMDVWAPLRSYDYNPYGPVPHWPKLPRPNVIGTVEVDQAANVQALIADAARHAGRGRQRVPTLVLVVRRDTERSFTPGTEEQLSEMLERVAGSAGAGRHLGWGPWRRAAADVRTEVYLGKESMLDTIRMFGNAVGVLGYHGASFVNALFADHPVCVEEITTFVDTAGSKIWRSNDPLSKTNSFLIWEKYIVQLQGLIDANHAQERWEVAPDKNQFIKRFERIYLSMFQVIQLERKLASCLEENVFLK